MAFPPPTQHVDYIRRVLRKAGLPDPLKSWAADPDKILWHYTTLESFEKIVRSRKIHLSPLDKMNDHQEGRWLSSLLEKDYFKPKDDRLFSDSYPVSESFGESRTFSFSLSDAGGDLLSQWRGYSDGGRGVSIGFRVGDLAVGAKSASDWSSADTSSIIVPVEYDETIHQLVVQEFYEIAVELNNDLSHLRNVTPGGHGKNRAIGMTFGPWAGTFHRALRMLQPIFKNPAFSEEREWRIAHFSEDRGASPPLPFPTRGFRFRSDDLIPYCEYTVGDAIQKVCLGPLCQATEHAVVSFLYSTLGTWIVPTRSRATLLAR